MARSVHQCISTASVLIFSFVGYTPTFGCARPQSDFGTRRHHGVYDMINDKRMNPATDVQAGNDS
jgi:hypothetical protein